MKKFPTIIFIFLHISCSTTTKENSNSFNKLEPFVSTTSVEEVRTRIENQPKDDIWWNVYGDKQRWNHKNLHRMYPTVNVYREGQVNMLDVNPNSQIPDSEVETPDGNMTFHNFIESDQSTTMGIVVVKDGSIVYEHYPRQEPYEKPIYWSVTKVLTSALVGILEDRGQVDVSLPISTYIPDLVGSDFKDVTVRNILDMASGVTCQENYDDWQSCYYQYSATVGDGFWNDETPDNPYEFLASAKPGLTRMQGTKWEYSGANSFLLGWLVEELMGMPFQDAFTQEVWRKIGTESDASILAPRYGVPITHGGLLARLRDVARFGMLYTPSAALLTQEEIISKRAVDIILNEGNPQLWQEAKTQGWLPNDFSHSAYQWDQVYENDDIFKGGWCGQGLLVNPSKNLVVAFTGYCKDAQSSEVDLLPILRNVLKEVYPIGYNAD
ncbi:serine hydrolase domain-containing protein [Ekhidna sp.]